MRYYWAFVLSVLILDFSNYLRHVLFHRMSLLWRFHSVHHSDPDYDFTLGFRFHPVEAIITTAVSLGVLVFVGVPVLAFLLYEILFVVTAMFSHGNVRMPEPVDRWLRYFVITPDMHRVHHSVILRESNSNFGTLLPWWDWVFGTYIAQPALGHEAMSVGLSNMRDPKSLTLGRLLVRSFYLRPEAS